MLFNIFIIMLAVFMFVAINFYDYFLFKEISKQELERDLKRYGGNHDNN